MFFLRQAVEPRGILAAGVCKQSSYLAEHWDDVKKRNNIPATYVEYHFDQIERDDRPLPVEVLRREIPWSGWRTQSSGIAIPEAHASALERLWREWTRGKRETAATRNPPWSEEELVLALDLYLREGLLDDTHPKVQELSHVLNALPIHADRPDTARFRNANGVALKLANFAAIDPGYPGVGMSRFGKKDADVWQRYSADEDRLHSAAASLRSGLRLSQAFPTAESLAVTVVAVEALAVDRFEVSRKQDITFAERKEQKLVLKYKEHLDALGHRTTRHRYNIEGCVLFCDLVDETDRVLFEAKGDIRRESIRMAVGQLLDYRRHESPPPRLAVLLPRRPTEDALAYLKSVRIEVVFRTTDGGWHIV